MYTTAIYELRRNSDFDIVPDLLALRPIKGFKILAYSYFRFTYYIHILTDKIFLKRLDEQKREDESF